MTTAIAATLTAATAATLITATAALLTTATAAKLITAAATKTCNFTYVSRYSRAMLSCDSSYYKDML